MTTEPGDLPDGHVAFLDNYEPALKDATYRITVSHALATPNPKGGAPVPDPDISVPDQVQLFTVAGPRFGLDPSEIHAQFPPPGATGRFAEVLPHVVLNKRLLPWERDIPPLDGSVPWLALLLFQEGELAGDPHDGTLVTANYAVSTTVSDLLAQAGSDKVRVPTLTTVSAAEEAMRCQVITVSNATFAAIVPTHLELPFLAHARRVDVGDKVSLDLKDDGVFSVVVANRFPLAGANAPARNIVHLVSLEGFGDLLGGTAPLAPTQSQVKLVSLASWSFACSADPAQTFGGLAKNLAYDAEHALRPASSLALRLPFTPASNPDAPTAAAERRLADGYVALGYHAPSGEDGFAWYRGPFTPTVANAVPKSATFESSAAATIYDPVTGLLDQSLAAAWQCGRSLALADQSFATTLMRLRHRANASLELMGSQHRTAPVRPQTMTESRLAALVADGLVALLHEVSTASHVRHVRHRRRRALAASAHDLRPLAARADVRAALAGQLADDPDAGTVARWLGRLWLLHGVPFAHLVPDARMLPPESARFFYLDAGWIGAMIDGAVTVGLGTSRESAVQAALTSTLERMATDAALAERSGATSAANPASGLLIRSALVAGWPGVSITAVDDGGSAVPPLRVDHVAPGVMLCLFNGVPTTVTLTEPHEGLEFGVSDEGFVATRTVAGSTVTEGAEVKIYDPSRSGAAITSIRAGGRRVLNLNTNASYRTDATVPSTPDDLLGMLAKTLSAPTSSMHPARFAVQMVKGPEQLTFSPNPPADPTKGSTRS